jgi:hypothetical protein
MFKHLIEHGTYDFIAAMAGGNYAFIQVGIFRKDQELWPVTDIIFNDQQFN